MLNATACLPLQLVACSCLGVTLCEADLSPLICDENGPVTLFTMNYELSVTNWRVSAKPSHLHDFPMFCRLSLPTSHHLNFTTSCRLILTSSQLPALFRIDSRGIVRLPEERRRVRNPNSIASHFSHSFNLYPFSFHLLTFYLSTLLHICQE
jgi:hypothetical protein